MTLIPENKRCPLCGEPNHCEIEKVKNTGQKCWCAAVSFSETLLARVPPELRRKSCICKACATETKSEKQ